MSDEIREQIRMEKLRFIDKLSFLTAKLQNSMNENETEEIVARIMNESLDTYQRIRKLNEQSRNEENTTL
jgi:hypothetical protein